MYNCIYLSYPSTGLKVRCNCWWCHSFSCL